MFIAGKYRILHKECLAESTGNIPIGWVNSEEPADKIRRFYKKVERVRDFEPIRLYFTGDNPAQRAKFVNKQLYNTEKQRWHVLGVFQREFKLGSLPHNDFHWTDSAILKTVLLYAQIRSFGNQHLLYLGEFKPVLLQEHFGILELFGQFLQVAFQNIWWKGMVTIIKIS